MTDRLSKLMGLVLVLVGLMPGRASALPWDIDMVDAYFYRAYEWSMQELPAGTVSRSADSVMFGFDPEDATNNAVQNGVFLSEISQTICNPDNPNYGRLSMPEGIAGDRYWEAEGEALFDVYCEACHGEDGQLGAPVSNYDATGEVIHEDHFVTEIPALSGGCVPKEGVDYSEATGEAQSAYDFCSGFSDIVQCQGDSSIEDSIGANCRWNGYVAGDPRTHAVYKVPSHCDAGLFAIIRNGNGGYMMGYHQAMSTEEIWSVVNYVRGLPGNEYVAPGQ